MIQDETLDNIRVIARSMMPDCNKINALVEAEDRKVVKAKLDKAMFHLHRFFDELESACRGEIDK